ncbi:MAG: YhjD/YihY/BrkB family envelope integrity protein, partial [Ostreibacterium sp.]
MSLLSNLEYQLWKAKPSWSIQLSRLLLGVIRATSKSHMKTHAASLTYSTLLAIVPLLALLFTLLKSFGIDAFLQRLINEVLAPMGKEATNVSHYLMQFVNNAQVGYLGGIGLIFLFYTVFILFYKIEQTLNDIWHIETNRRLKTRLINYMGTLMLTVIIASLALGLKVLVHSDLLTNAVNSFSLLT